MKMKKIVNMFLVFVIHVYTAIAYDLKSFDMYIVNFNKIRL